MSPRDPEMYLEHMLDSCQYLLQLAPTKTRQDYENDRMFRRAVERELMIIGEALFQLNRCFPDMAAGISEYLRIINFRHILVHGYAELKPEVVWHVLTEKLELLERELLQMLGSKER